jgi:hypothetical protein
LLRVCPVRSDALEYPSELSDRPTKKTERGNSDTLYDHPRITETVHRCGAVRVGASATVRSRIPIRHARRCSTRSRQSVALPNRRRNWVRRSGRAEPPASRMDSRDCLRRQALLWIPVWYRLIEGPIATSVASLASTTQQPRNPGCQRGPTAHGDAPASCLTRPPRSDPRRIRRPGRGRHLTGIQFRNGVRRVRITACGV